MSKILILSPHTDDAEIGAGGTIYKFKSKNELLWVVFSTCEDSLPEDMPNGMLVDEFDKVIKFLDIQTNVFNYRVRKLDEHRQEILEHLIRIKETFKPELVIGPSLNDFHQDHKVVANEMVRAFKTSASIICYELPWNNIQFNTQMFVRLTKEQIEQKIKILSFYKSQMSLRGYPFTKDYIKGLATVRGTQINQKYAEAFEVIRWIINEREGIL